MGIGGLLHQRLVASRIKHLPDRLDRLDLILLQDLQKVVVDKLQRLHIGGDVIVTEIEVPRWMAGRKLGELQLRSRYHVSVFIVREIQEGRPPRFITPSADHVFRAGDLILISGTPKDIKALTENL